MSKRMMTIVIGMLLSVILVLPVSGQTISYIDDDAGLLNPEEIATLEDKATELASEYHIAPVIVTVDSLGGESVQDYADDYYNHMGYGEDGVLFLLAIAEREWYISTSGTVMYALTDYGVQQLGEIVVPCLAEEYWYTGFNSFLDSLPYYLDSYENGTPVDGYAECSGNYNHGEQGEILYYEEDASPNFFYSLLAGIAAAAISIVIMRSSMNTKRPQRSVGAYMEEGSWNLYQHRDLFLYSNVTKTRRQENKPSSGGGSSVHRSSGGRRHGGGGGKF